MTTKKIGFLSLTLMSVTGVFSIKMLPMMAEYGLSGIVYYALIALLFFIPSALVCAELASAWPKTGGIYVWVREAFGARAGFITIWFEWTNNLIAFPANLSLIAATILYAFHPEWLSDKRLLLSIMLLCFWGTTLINFFGMRFSAILSNIGLLLGTLLPCLLLISLATKWLFSGHPLAVHFSAHALLPTFGWRHSAFLAGGILGFAGIQISAYHAQEVDNPKRNYPLSIFFAAGIILLFAIACSLSIAMVIPQKHLSVLAGLLQTIYHVLSVFHLQSAIVWVLLLITVGCLAQLNLWLISPAKGLLASANAGDLPKWFAHTNARGVPVTILLIQAIVTSLIAGLYEILPDVNQAYWFLLALSAILTLLMYALIFAAAIRLRYTQAEKTRHYRVPFGQGGIWLIAGGGFIVSLIGVVLGILPPEQLYHAGAHHYVAYMIGAVSVMVLGALWIRRR